jgi:hypothetical protein
VLDQYLRYLHRRSCVVWWADLPGRVVPS